MPAVVVVAPPPPQGGSIGKNRFPHHQGHTIISQYHPLSYHTPYTSRFATMSHPRIEEVSDSDPDMVSDPEEMDLEDFDDTDIMRRVEPKKAPQPQAPTPSSSSSTPSQPLAPQGQGQMPRNPTADDRSMYANFQCLYPVYFDASRSRAEGRRVSSALAVKNPLAREIASACSRLRLQTVLESEKTHPKDWSNPGRVKVALKQSKANGNGGGAQITNKHHLYLLVAQHLRENPTSENSAGLRFRMNGEIHPPEGKPYPKPAVPRGWKMNEFLPYLSAGMTGGGVSDNLLKDFMSQMQGGGDPMSALMAAQAGGSGSGNASDDSAAKKKKDKKQKGRA